VAFWKPPMYNSPYMNWKRAMYAMSSAIMITEPIRHFHSNMYVLNQFYEWPRTRSEYNIFFKEIFRLPNFWSELGKKIVFSHVAAGGSSAIQLAWWQSCYGGTWSPQEYADYNSYKHLYCSLMAFIPTCGLVIPFENARRAYYADKTWPIELRRNYTSPTQAMFRIPFEEGPSFLFRGGAPLAMNQWMFWTTFCTLYTFHKNKYFFLWVYQGFSYDYIKMCNMVVSFGIASALAYPFYFAREMVDLWPKERGGHCTWNNSYKNCFKWQIDNMDFLGYNFMTNYWQWMRRYGFTYFAAIWVADNLGMMSNNNESFNSLEVMFPNFVEAS
jgi:solute carrier family 25 (mitochondrial oxoglutarate transporter), member 11